MRRVGFWLPVGLLAAVALALWGVWTARLNTHNHDLANALEAERQRSFVDTAYHVEQIQAQLGKGLATGDVRQNMRYMSDVRHHSDAAIRSITALPIPGELSESARKLLQQTGDFATSLMRNEAAGRPMTARERAELSRLRQESVNLAGRLNEGMVTYNQGLYRWHEPARLTWNNLIRGPASPAKPNPSPQSPGSMIQSGFEQVGTPEESLPVFIYDGPFSDHVARQAPAVGGMPVSQEQASGRLQRYLPQAARYQTLGVTEVANNLPSWSFQLTPTDAGNAYTATVEITKNGGHLAMMLNGRMVGSAALDLNRARQIGQEYLAQVGYHGMAPTYGQVQDNTATIAYAYRAGGVIAYPDQIKVKVALDNGEILSVDARQYLMHHKERPVPRAAVTPKKAEEAVNPDLEIERVQLAIIPDQAGTGEILAYEFLGSLGGETFLVYINAQTGHEEQILQLIQTDGGTFTL